MYETEGSYDMLYFFVSLGGKATRYLGSCRSLSNNVKLLFISKTDYVEAMCTTVVRATKDTEVSMWDRLHTDCVTINSINVEQYLPVLFLSKVVAWNAVMFAHRTQLRSVSAIADRFKHLIIALRISYCILGN